MSVQYDSDRAVSETEAVESGATARASIPKDDAFHILQNARRRATLRYILAHTDRAQFVMRDVTEAVAAWEYDTSVERLDSDQRQRVYIALYQSHLPKLDDHDVIDYDQSRGIIEPTELVGALAPYLDDGLDSGSELVVEPPGEDGGSGSEDGGGLARTVSALLSK
jgi:anion-transporting  ArsA/GET3 family ATPase